MIKSILHVVGVAALVFMIGCGDDNGVGPDNGGGNGSFTDSRDGQKYRTVTIGGKTWMAENLNYIDSSWSHNGYSGIVPFGMRGSWCHNNEPDSCAKYGRLYTWDAAMVACPAGWSLPTRQNWDNLVNAVGPNPGTKLKAGSLWDGTDNFDFSALPGGVRYLDTDFGAVGIIGVWWTATEASTTEAWAYSLLSGDAHVFNGVNNKPYHGFSVRCVKN